MSEIVNKLEEENGDSTPNKRLVDISDSFENTVKDKRFLLCTLDEINFDEFEKIDYFTITGNNVYLCRLETDDVECESNAMFINSIYHSLSSIDFNFAAGHPVPIFKKYACDATFNRTIDYGISDQRYDVIVPGLLGFINQDLELIVEDCVHFLTEYTNFKYSIGMKIYCESESFKAVLFILERIRNDISQEKIALLHTALLNKQKRLPNYKCEYSDCKFDLNDECLSKYNARIYFYREINDENYNNDISFKLPGEVFRLSDETEVDIFLNKTWFSYIRQNFYAWIKRLKKKL